MRAVCDKKKKGPRTPIADATTASVMATKLYSSFFSARRRASAIIRLVGTFDLGSSNSRYVSGTQRNAKHRGVVVRQSGRPASHAYGAFHYIKPFQCIIYFCVSHLRYGLCTGDGGQRALCNIADLKIAAWQRLDSARPVYIILTYDFSRKFCFLHTFIATSPFCIVPAVARRARRVAFRRRKKTFVCNVRTRRDAKGRRR